MPPQSRGSSPASRHRPFTGSESLPPTLRPYLENLPSPLASLPGDQRTPTGPHMIIPDRDVITPTLTPRRSRGPTSFGAVANKHSTEDEDSDTSVVDEGQSRFEAVSPEQESNEMDVADVTVDDDDFESHYSHQNSSESDEDDEDEAVKVAGDTLESGDHGERHERLQNGSAEAGDQPSPALERPDTLSRIRSLPARPPSSHTAAHSHPHQQEGRLHISQSTTSLPPIPPPPLYPPFYNRPPTPLPPSPSLTSLLRPPSLLNRSTASTRQTTPDSSDVETPNDTEAAVAHSARRANPVPPTSPKVPTYEYYGFVLYLASTLTFLFYILWSYLPSRFLHALGITYYPDRWWSLAMPAWIVMLLIFIYIALLSYNVEHLTLPLPSLECMVDDAANVAILDGSGRLRKGGSKGFVRELEERTKFERERESGRAKNGKGRKTSKSGSSTSHRPKDKGKRRSSRAIADHDVEIHGLPPGNYQYPPSNPSAAFSSNQVTAPHYHPSAYPYITSSIHPSQTQLHHQRERPHRPDLDWKLMWNEGTDAVMDVPLGEFVKCYTAS